MKGNRFKLRPIQGRLRESSHWDEAQSASKETGKDNADFTKEILIQMQDLLKQALSANKENPQPAQELEFRDRIVQSTIRTGSTDTYDQDTLEAWIGEVCRNVASTTFHYYLNQQMTYQQAKVYCCEQILRNVALFAEQHKVDSGFYGTIDKIMKEKIMPYLALKYPLSESQHTNKSLQRIVKDINNIEMLTYDFFFNSNITLEYRENGNYNDIIMQVLNEIISLADSPHSPDTTVFKDFDNFITGLFDQVYDPVWMTQRTNTKSSNHDFEGSKENILSERIIKAYKGTEQIEKYRQKVQEYTHYDVGRKIPQSVHCYTEEQIKSKHLQVKSPQILRILTKWCEELWQKYSNQNYYIDRSEGIYMQKSKQINVVYEWFRLALKEALRTEKGKIEKYMSNVETNLYSQEFKILQSELLSKEAVFLNRYERICGKFSAKVVENLKNCMVIYLNRLIHGLMTVSENLFNNKLRGMPSWPYPPNLISFKVGDLLRCRISSQEKEIIRLFEQIQWLSDTNPQKIKIIRIKNRLKSGTNDLLINVRYNNSLIAQIQLKAKTKLKSSRFAECSFKFSHFIYELQRSYFGPISEMCSIWVNLDHRSKLYRDLVQSENLKDSLVKEISCVDREKHHQMQGFTNSPFICNSCGKSFSSDNYLLQHSKCKACSYFKCALCQICERASKDLLQTLYIDEKIKSNLQNERCDYLPARGIFINIENNAEGRVNLFKVIEILQKSYVFVLKNDLSFELASELKTQYQVSSFVNDNIVYNLIGTQPESLKNCTTKMAVTQFIMPLYISRCYRLQKQAISLNKLANVQFEVPLMASWLKGSGGSKKFVKQLEVSSQNLVNLDFIPDELVNLEFINVNLNRITDLSALARFKKLQTIFCLSNALSQFPASLCSLPLKFLSIAENSIVELPAEFEGLQSLEVIRFNKNKMIQFPKVITKLANLRQIHAYLNGISIVPDTIGNLKKLEVLGLSQNNIEVLPKSIEQLQSLQSILLVANKIKEIVNIEFKKNAKLKEVLLEKNNIVQIPPCLSDCHSLARLDLSKNCIVEASFADISLHGLKELNLSQNKITAVLSLSSIKSVTNLNLKINQITELTPDIIELKLLQVLDLNSNKLKGLPPAIVELRSLKKLMLSDNKEIAIPEAFSLLKIEALSLRGCNLKQTPKEVTQLKKLKQLNIALNELQQLPAEIGNLKQLQLLQMEDNYIKAFPAQLQELKCLKKIKYKQKNPCDLDIVLKLSLNSLSQQLSFSYSKLQKLPTDIPFNSYLEELDISDNNIRTIPESIKNLVNLRVFKASRNQFETVPEGLFDLKELQKLYLNKNIITSLPDQFIKLTKLIQLFIQDNKLTAIPETILTIYSRNFTMQYNGNPLTKIPFWLIIKDTKASIINLSKLQLTQLPQFSSLHIYTSVTAQHNLLREFQSVTKLHKLKFLNLNYNQITKIPSSIKNCSTLQSLQLSNNFIEDLPAELAQMPLKKLKVNHNPLRTIHQSFSKLKQLELRISPESFEALSQNQCLQWIQVNKLDLSQMELKHLSGHIGEIASVKCLDVSKNELESLPDEITKIRGMLKLIVSENRLQRLPESINLWSDLKELRAQKCELSELPVRFGELVKLTILLLSENKLSRYPDLSEEMILNSKLVTLQAKLNEFTIIPQSLCQLPQLRSLTLADNRITAIPLALQSSNLKELDLSNNAIAEIPSFISHTKITARNLHLNGNPIQKIDDPSEDLFNKLSMTTQNEIAHLLPSPPDPYKDM